VARQSRRKRRDEIAKELARRQQQAAMSRGLPPGKGAQQIERVTRTVERHEQYTGPLPHPEILAGYEATLPGAAERILTHMENEGHHRRELEKAEVEHLQRAHLLQIRHQGRGQLFGLLVAFGGFALSAFAIYCGHPKTAAVIAGVDLLGLVTVFVTGARAGRADKDEPESKDVARSER
jgi:uncharacterized membrane protein